MDAGRDTRTGGSGGNSPPAGGTGGGGAGGGGAGGTASDAGSMTTETGTGGDGPPGDVPSGPPASPERFAGRWDYATGEARLECPGAQPLTQDLYQQFLTFQIGAGVAPLLLASPGCTLRFNIQGQAAVIQPGQSCMNAVAGRTAVSTPTVFTFTLDEQVARQQSTWTVVFAATPNAPCTLTAQGVLAKVP